MLLGVVVCLLAATLCSFTNLYLAGSPPFLNLALDLPVGFCLLLSLAVVKTNSSAIGFVISSCTTVDSDSKHIANTYDLY